MYTDRSYECFNTFDIFWMFDLIRAAERWTIYSPQDQHLESGLLKEISPGAWIESSPVWDTSCLTELIYYLIDRQCLCGKCPKTVQIQYSLPECAPVVVVRSHRHLADNIVHSSRYTARDFFSFSRCVCVRNFEDITVNDCVSLANIESSNVWGTSRIKTPYQWGKLISSASRKCPKPLTR